MEGWQARSPNTVVIVIPSLRGRIDPAGRIHSDAPHQSGRPGVAEQLIFRPTGPHPGAAGHDGQPDVADGRRARRSRA
jgi:hypothetical protein